MLGAMRKFARSRASAVLLALIMFGFIFYGANNFLNGVPQDGLARVGNFTISTREVTQLLDRQIDRIRQERKQTVTRAEAAKQGGVAQIVQTLIQRDSVLAYADQMGIQSSPFAVAKLLALEPSLQDGVGKLDRGKEAQLAERQGMNVKEFEADLRRQLTLSYLERGLMAGVQPPEIIRDPMVAFFGEKRSLAFARFTPAAFPAIPTPTDADLRKFYNERKTMFEEPERRRISMLSYAAEDFIDKVSVDDARERADYDKRIKEFSDPDTRVVDQIQADDRAVIQTLVDSVKSGGKLDDALSKAKGAVRTTLTVKPGDLKDKSFDSNVFLAPAKSIFGPFESGGKWTAAIVQEIRPGAAKPYEQVAAKIRDGLVKRDAEKAFQATREEFLDSLSAATLADAAKQIGAPVFSFEPVDRQGRTADGVVVQALAAHPEQLAEIFKLEKGQNGAPLEGDSQRAVMRVEAVIPPRTPPFEEVKEKIVPLWKSVKQVEALDRVAKEVADAVKAGKPLEQTAKAAKLSFARPPQPATRNQGQNIDPAVLQAAFTLKQGEAAVAHTREGEPWIVQVERIEKPTESEAAALKGQIGQAIKQTIESDLFDAFAREAVRKAKPNVSQKSIDAFIAKMSQGEQ